MYSFGALSLAPKSVPKRNHRQLPTATGKTPPFRQVGIQTKRPLGSSNKTTTSTYRTMSMKTSVGTADDRALPSREQSPNHINIMKKTPTSTDTLGIQGKNITRRRGKDSDASLSDPISLPNNLIRVRPRVCRLPDSGATMKVRILHTQMLTFSHRIKSKWKT